MLTLCRFALVAERVLSVDLNGHFNPLFHL